MTSPIKRIDIFPHCGTQIPGIVAEDVLLATTPQKIAQLIEAERDTGLERIMSQLQRRKDSVVVMYDYVKFLGDVNRLELRAQVPENIYSTGEPLLKITDQVRNALVNRYVKPWQLNLLEICKKHPQAMVIHWHTYNKYSGFDPTLKTSHKSSGELRPMGQILEKYAIRSDQLAGYLDQIPKGEYLNEHIDMRHWRFIKGSLTKALSSYDQEESEPFQDSNPYILYGTDSNGSKIFAPCLPPLIDKLFDSKRRNFQLVLDVRKDLVATETAQIDLLNAVDSILDYLMPHMQ